MEEIIKTLSSAVSGRMLTTEQRAVFEQGLNLLENIPFAQAFVRDSRRFRDYHRRVRQMIIYLQTLSAAAAANVPSTPTKRHVGRPTNAERAAYIEKQKQAAVEEAKKSLFPEMKPQINLQPLTYNGIVADPNGDSVAATMPNLKQIQAFLTPSLQERVNSVRDLRNEMASKAEQAKMMVEANEKSMANGAGVIYPESEVAELTTRAVDIESHILPDVYTAVDREMGECYLRLHPKTGDPEYIAYIEKNFKVSPDDLRTSFKPFYEKALARDPRFAEQIAEQIASDRPEIKAQRDAAAKHKAEADALVKYIIRKDKPSTQARIRGLKERIDRLRNEYSDIVTSDELIGYEAILTKTIEEAPQKKSESKGKNKKK